jgi:hypothetical protein
LFSLPEVGDLQNQVSVHPLRHVLLTVREPQACHTLERRTTQFSGLHGKCLWYYDRTLDATTKRSYFLRL